MAARTDRENDLAPPSKVREYFLLAKWDWRGTYSQGADETRRSNAKAKTTIMSNLYEIHTRPFKTGNPTGITFKSTLDLSPRPAQEWRMHASASIRGSNDVGWKPGTSLDWQGRRIRNTHSLRRFIDRVRID